MNQRILIIDDDPQLREVYQSVLKAEGFDVFVQSDGEEALNFIMKEEKKPDLLILDIMIPKIHGLNVLDIIKNQAGLKDIKVIMLSALSDEATKKKAKDFGAYKYLVKSETPMSDIVEIIKKALEN